MADRCEIKGCRAPVNLVYLDHGLCTPHWDALTGDEAPPNALKVVLGVAGRGLEAEGETTMSTEQTAAPAEAATAKEETPMKAKSKTTKTAATKAPTKKAAAAKPEKKAARKREPNEKVELRTLALRVTNQEFDLVHKAAGPRNLSQFMRATVLAAAQKHLNK